MGVNLNASSEATPTASAIGSVMNVEEVGHSRWMEQSAPLDSDHATTYLVAWEVIVVGKQVISEFSEMRTPVPKPRLRSVIIGPSVRHDLEDPLVTVVPSLLRQVLTFIPTSPSHPFLNCLTHVDLDHNTIIPTYFHDNDLLIHLAFILYPQLGDNALEKIAKVYMDVEGEGSDDDDMLVGMEKNEVENEEAVPVQEMNEIGQDADVDLDMEILEALPAMF